MSFNMYIMFTPPGNESREVPLLRLPWSWSDAAIYFEEDLLKPWRKAPDQIEPAVDLKTAVEEYVHPHWDDTTEHHKQFE